jgi:hypothetical protein
MREYGLTKEDFKVGRDARNGEKEKKATAEEAWEPGESG